ncbi:MAG TPA: maleylpyruvate isomerase family mycothiol-dependent enzyme [Acidimicrobiia bacterium]|nr:maleylpyruvate isomerase family mycothiol-dependent enzyme [Acidimicrobiia bacterium]
MTLPRTEVETGIMAELISFRALLERLDDHQWAMPTRCEGWTVANVASHVVGSMADVVAGRLDGLGSPEATAREVAEREGQSPAELAEELAAVTKQAADLLAVFDDAAWTATAPGGYTGTLGEGVEALWYDTWAHQDDILAALDQPPVLGPGLRAGLHHVAENLAVQGWGPGTLALDGVEEIPVGAGGTRVTGDPYAFVLAATGRGDPATFGLDETVNIYR